MLTLGQSKKSLENLFPLPHLLQVPAVGIDISDESIKFIELQKKGGGFIVSSFGENKLPEGAVINGEIKDRKALVSVLRLIQEKNGFKSANFSLPEEKAFLFRVTVPETDHEGIMTNLSFQLEKKVPVSLAEAVFDYDLLGKDSKKEEREAVVTVFPVDFVESYLGAFKESGLSPTSLEIEAQAIASAVVPRHESGTFLVVDFGNKRTGLSVVSRGAVVYTSTLEVGGDTINRKLKETLNVDDSEIIGLKNDVGFSDPTNREVYEAVSGTIFALKDEINKHFLYWNNRAEEGGNEIIEKMYLCGGNSNIAGIKEHLSEALSLPVEIGNVWQNIFNFDEYVPPINRKKASSFATAIGLALESINA